MERSASKNILSLEPSTAFFPRRTNQPLPATSPQAGGTSSPAPPPAAAPPPRHRSDPPSSFLLAAAVELDESRRRCLSSPASSSADCGGGPRALRPGARRILVAAFELSGLDLGGSRQPRSNSRPGAWRISTAQLGASWHRPRRPPPSSAPASQESPRRPCRTSTPALFRPCPPPTAPSSASALLGLVAPCSLRPPPALLGLTPPYSLHPPLLFLGLAPPCSLRAAATTARSWRRRLPAIHSDQPVCDIFSSSSIPLSHLFLSSHFQQRRSSALNLLICYPGVLLHPPPPCTCAGVLLACRGWPAPSWWLRTAVQWWNYEIQEGATTIVSLVLFLVFLVLILFG